MFGGYSNTGNIGKVILTLGELLGVDDGDDCADAPSAFNDAPCRVASNALPVESISEHTWIGHFMDDRWMQAKKIATAGCTCK